MLATARARDRCSRRATAVIPMAIRIAAAGVLKVRYLTLYIGDTVAFPTRSAAVGMINQARARRTTGVLDRRCHSIQPTATRISAQHRSATGTLPNHCMVSTLARVA